MINDKDYSIKDSAGEGGGGWVGERQGGLKGWPLSSAATRDWGPMN